MREFSPPLTPDQEQAVTRLVVQNPNVQMLLERMSDLEVLVAKQQQLIDDLLAAPDAGKTAAQARAELGGPLRTTPVATLAKVAEAARKYIDATGNEGLAARRLKSGDLLIDLDNPELHSFLPTQYSPAFLYRVIKRANGYTARVTPDDRQLMGWDPTRNHKHAFVYLSAYV